MIGVAVPLPMSLIALYTVHYAKKAIREQGEVRSKLRATNSVIGLASYRIALGSKLEADIVASTSHLVDFESVVNEGVYPPGFEGIFTSSDYSFYLSPIVPIGIPKNDVLPGMST